MGRSRSWSWSWSQSRFFQAGVGVRVGVAEIWSTPQPCLVVPLTFAHDCTYRRVLSSTMWIPLLHFLDPITPELIPTEAPLTTHFASCFTRKCTGGSRGQPGHPPKPRKCLCLCSYVLAPQKLLKSFFSKVTLGPS